jgi:hypothetical protein
MYFGLSIRIGSARDQARYHLRKENDDKNDGDGHPEQRDANRAALPALISATVQLNES